MNCPHLMVNPKDRRCVSCGEILGKREHMHLYGPWSYPEKVAQEGLWDIIKQLRVCSVGPQACGYVLVKRKRLPRNNHLSREHVYEVDPQ